MEADSVVLMITIVGSVLGSTLATISLLLSHMNRLEDKFDEEFKTVHGEFKQVHRNIAGLGSGWPGWMAT